MEKRDIIDTDVIQICFNNLCSKLENTKEIYFIDSYSITKSNQDENAINSELHAAKNSFPYNKSQDQINSLQNSTELSEKSINTIWIYSVREKGK